MRKETATCVQFVQSPWLTVGQAASYLQMSKDDIHILVNSGKVESRKRGKRGTFIHASWLDEYMLSLPSAAKTPETLRAVI